MLYEKVLNIYTEGSFFPGPTGMPARDKDCHGRYWREQTSDIYNTALLPILAKQPALGAQRRTRIEMSRPTPRTLSSVNSRLT